MCCAGLPFVASGDSMAGGLPVAPPAASSPESTWESPAQPLEKPAAGCSLGAMAPREQGDQRSGRAPSSLVAPTGSYLGAPPSGCSPTI